MNANRPGNVARVSAEMPDALRDGNVAARLELRHLRYFRAVAEELNFTRAAERLHIAQPPLSQQIRQLEEELGVLLIERSSRPLRLTEAGELLLRRSIGILAEVEAAAQDVRRIGRGQSGRLAIGFAGSAMFSILPDILNSYRDQYPDVELVFREMLASEIAIALEKRTIDVGFARPGLLPEDDLEQHLLAEEALVAAVPLRHPLATCVTIPVARLNGQAAILYPRYPKPSLTDLILQQLQQHQVSLHLVQQADNIQTVIGLVAAGAGISFVPASVSLQDRNNVRYIPIAPQVLLAPMTIVWRRPHVTTALRHFIDVVAQRHPAIC